MQGSIEDGNCRASLSPTTLYPHIYEPRLIVHLARHNTNTDTRSLPARTLSLPANDADVVLFLVGGAQVAGRAGPAVVHDS